MTDKPKGDLDPLGFGDDTVVGGGAADFDPDAKKAELKRRRLGQRALMVGGGAVVTVAVLGIALRAVFSGGEQPVAVASVADGGKVAQAPGAPDLPPATKQAFQDKNTQIFTEAERQNKTSVGYPVFDPAPPPPPQPIQAVQPVTQAPIQVVPAVDEKALRDAIVRAINDTKLKATTDRKPTMVAGGDATGAPAGSGPWGTPQSVGPVVTPSAYSPPAMNQGAGRGAAAGMSGGVAGGTGGGHALAFVDSGNGGTEMAAAHEAYGVTRVAADSDAPAEVVVEVLGGPFVGATVYGTPAFRQKTASVTITRMIWRGQEYAVKGFLQNAETRSPALPVDVDNYYFERIIWPAFAGGLGIAGRVASQPVSTVQSVGTGLGGTIVTQTQPSTGRQIAGGFAEGGAGTASQILKQDAGEMKPTVRVAANLPVVIQFTSGVRQGDLRK
ncbi:hypothetical protein [Azospirillum canadense]|uniref:hypothetical protein n=1 Tax=Azospirillum canadense TaxID=403962 RepID=UPI002225F9B6|nr:hypothetical protein [Azospirillum canadense]MCW2240376.1 hypothetical protein [Azospirillum canadense]